MAYRVAVIENESESLRYGYANVFQRLQQLKRLRHYIFERFDSQTLNRLFDNGRLMTFDSLFISTNATSDSVTLSLLRERHEDIERFITAGKGLFVSNQKKLAFQQRQPELLPATGFLPRELEVHLVERPEPSSSDGIITTSLECISSPSGSNILLEYPESVTSDVITKRCKENDFKVHLYRAYLYPVVDNAYHALIYDKSYNDCLRPLVIVSRQSLVERVVLSTIALDWEWHWQLLTNIVVFISEGFPTVAFVAGGGRATGDFDYLVSSADLSKIPHSVYQSVDAIPRHLLGVHGIYVVSPECSDAQVTTLWSWISSKATNRYARLYRLKRDGDSVSLVQYTNYSSIDVAVDAAITWIDIQFKDGMWGGGFWNTYDVLLMMCELGIEPTKYLAGVFSEVRSHYKNGSYDGVHGATCGLLELCVHLLATDPSTMSRNGFDESRIREIACWVLEACKTQSPPGRQSALLSLASYAKWAQEVQVDWPEKSQYDSLLASARRDLSGIEGIPLAAGCSELDIARLIRFAILVSASNDEIVSLFGKLHNMQHEDGSWRSIGRTAYIVINLLDCYEALAKAMTTDTELNEVIYNAILYLRAAYDEATGTWDRDIQATAKAAHAIGMHNRRFAYSTQDFFETIRREVRQVDRSEGVREMRRELAELRELAKSCRESARTAVAEREATMQSVELFRSDERRLARYETIWRVIATTSSLLLAGLVVSLFVHQFQVAISLFSEIGSLLPLIISAVLAVPITIAMQPRKFTARHKIAGKQES